MLEIVLQKNKKIYFASDFHLGAPNKVESREREKLICDWLDQISLDAQVIFLVGDLFDFWFEYKRVIPKGYSRFFGKLAELSDRGIKLVVFKGNHDMWMLDFMEVEFDAEIYRKPKDYHISGKQFLIGHGDGYGNGDTAYKYLKVIFENPVCNWLFRNLVHPDIGLYLGYAWAGRSWRGHDKSVGPHSFKSNEDELLYQYCREQEELKHRDYYIFGHRHFKLDIPINTQSRYINLGDWIHFFSYAVFDGEEVTLEEFKHKL